MKRIRKPRKLNIKKYGQAAYILQQDGYLDQVCFNKWSYCLRDAKELHSWLSKVIKYLEQEKRRSRK